MNYQNRLIMFTAKFIKNIFLDGKGLKAIGRSGSLTRVFAEQGDLDGSCSVYSLLMMLVFHQKLDWEDLINSEPAKKNKFVDTIQHEFLYTFKGICVGGHVMKDISDKLNSSFGQNLSEVFTTSEDASDRVCRRVLHEKIRAQLDNRKPVLLGFRRASGTGHSVVAIGYRREAWDRLRLFCLDPGRMLPIMQVWNNIIDIDYLSIDDESKTDINHYEDNKVCVEDILIIHDTPLGSDCPF